MNSPRLLVVLDVDSTLTQHEGIDRLAACVSPEVEAEVARITAKAMRGELDFKESLRQRVATLQGVTVDQIEEANRSISLTPGAEKLVSVLRAHGHVVGAVSGGFHHMVDPLAMKLGLDYHRANHLEVVDGVVTGRVDDPIIGAQEKADTLVEWATECSIPLSQTVAIGDGGNDVAMLRQAGLGIAFMAKAVAKDAADIVMDTADLAQVLSILGFVDR